MTKKSPPATIVPKPRERRKPFVLPSEVREEIKKLPRILLEEHVHRRLDSLPHRVSTEAREALISHIFSNPTDEFVWTTDDSFPDGLKVDLDLTPEEHAEISRRTDTFSDDMVSAINRVVKRQSLIVFKELKKRWPEERLAQDAISTSFNARLSERWGPAVESLRMLIVSSLDIGAERGKDIRRLRSRRPINYVLIRLHARACQVAEEIVTLLENGLADGALGRWRTMLELTVVGTLIEGGDDVLAERYVAHSIVEEWSQAKEYMEIQVPLGARPMRKADLGTLKSDYDALIAQYGRPFGTLYGWAAEVVGSQKPTFKDLMKLAGKNGMTHYYKMANHDVHAGSRRLNERISDLFDSGIILAGKSNAGLAVPGINAAYSLVQMTSLLLGTPRTVEQMLSQKILLRMRGDVRKEFERAAKQLRLDEYQRVAGSKS